jgi:catechol 2,3-dioxygenase-like lactoylglutathione lyase family enzyme
MMLTNSPAFSGFSVNDLAIAKQFYGETLGLHVERDQMGLTLRLASGTHIFVYDKPDHQPASYTILNFPVDDIDQVVDELAAKGISFEHYGMPGQDEKGIARGLAAHRGPDIAWFKDPSGNILSVLQES